MLCSLTVSRTMGPLALSCLFLVCSSVVDAFPSFRSQQSTQGFVHNDRLPRRMSFADGILADYMMQEADFNRDNKMTADEIASFYMNVVHYSPYVSHVYGDTFIQLADTDEDGALDRNELILMLVAMDAVEWMKR